MFLVLLFLFIILAGSAFGGSLFTSGTFSEDESGVGILANPVVNSSLINSTNPATNDTNENLTAHVTTTDGDGDSVKVMYTWLLGGNPIALLNLPFEADGSSNTTDYSGYTHSGVVVGGAFWNSTGG